MECQELPEGYKVHYTPMAPGNYLISVKYGGPFHVSGSPFKAKVAGKNQHPSSAVGKLRPGGHICSHEQFNPARRALNLSSRSQIKRVVSLIG